MYSRKKGEWISDINLSLLEWILNRIQNIASMNVIEHIINSHDANTCACICIQMVTFLNVKMNWLIIKYTILSITCNEHHLSNLFKLQIIISGNVSTSNLQFVITGVSFKETISWSEHVPSSTVFATSVYHKRASSWV